LQDVIDTRIAARCVECRNQARISRVGIGLSRAWARQSRLQRKSKDTRSEMH
jgi:hypothetical protein